MKIIYLMLFLSVSYIGQAQHFECGAQYIKNKISEIAPGFKVYLMNCNAPEGQKKSAGKKSADSSYPIPVVFHFILTDDQISKLGGEAGIRERIAEQIAVVNEDFNAENKDTVRVPFIFKQHIGTPGIRFALAHTAPDGSSTPGYEIRHTAINEFSVDGTTGSTFAFSDAKYSVAGGADAWDPTSYLNVWIINTISNTASSGYLALTIPPSYTMNTGVPQNEMGLVINYGAFGRRGSQGQFYIFDRAYGRTMTHELGHYFELSHIWGDDDDLCPGSGGADDGFADTPPQGGASYGTPVFPHYDNCSASGTSFGVMFMNFMDYTNDSLRTMFSKEQCSRIRYSVNAITESQSLVTHPLILEYPDSASHQSNQPTYHIFPNPVTNDLVINFDQPSPLLKKVCVLNSVGQVVLQKSITMPQAYISFNVTNNAAGVYIVVIYFDKYKLFDIFLKI